MPGCRRLPYGGHDVTEKLRALLSAGPDSKALRLGELEKLKHKSMHLVLPAVPPPPGVRHLLTERGLSWVSVAGNESHASHAALGAGSAQPCVPARHLVACLLALPQCVHHSRVQESEKVRDEPDLCFCRRELQRMGRKQRRHQRRMSGAPFWPRRCWMGA